MATARPGKTQLFITFETFFCCTVTGIYGTIALNMVAQHKLETGRVGWGLGGASESCEEWTGSQTSVATLYGSGADGPALSAIAPECNF